MTFHKSPCDGKEAAIRKMIAAGKTSIEIAEALGVPRKTLVRFVATRGLGPWKTRRGPANGIPIPKDFAARRAEMTNAQLCTHYGRGHCTIERWARESGSRREKPVYVRPLDPVPDDFRQHMRDSVANICARYGVGRDKVARWLSETGAAPRQPFHLVNARTPANPASVSRVQRDMSRVGQAADFLRKYSGVWRCTPTGSPKADGTHWRRGSAILTDAEIIERAEWLGWDANAWSRVA